MRASGAILIGLVGSALVAVVNTVQAEGDSLVGAVRASSWSALEEQAGDLERVAAMIVKLTNQYRRHRGAQRSRPMLSSRRRPRTSPTSWP